MILGFDFETTGVEPQKDRAIEMGAVLFDKQFNPIAQFSAYIWDETVGQISPEVSELTRISMRDLQTMGIPFDVALRKMHSELLQDQKIDGILAHNAVFDKSVFRSEVDRYNVGYATNLLVLPWVCSRRDLASNKKMRCQKLSHLALDYGVVVDPSTLHRAVGDVRLMGQMLQAAKADWSDMLRRAQAQKVIVQADVPSPFGPRGDGGRGKELAKANGYRWEDPGEESGQKWEKRWVKQILEFELDEEARLMPFPVRVLARITTQNLV